MSDVYQRFKALRSQPLSDSISEVARLSKDTQWEDPSKQMFARMPFSWSRKPEDRENLNIEHRLEEMLIKSVRTVALINRSRTQETVTFVASAFPVGRGREGEIDLLGLDSLARSVVVELKVRSNDPWSATVEAAEYLSRMRFHFEKVRSWFHAEFNGMKVSRDSRAIVLMPTFLLKKGRNIPKLALAFELMRRLKREVNMDIELYRFEFYGGQNRLPGFHRLTMAYRVEPA